MERVLIVLILAGAALSSGCGVDQPAAAVGVVTKPRPAETLQFVPASPLQMEPNAEAVLTVVVEPQGTYDVRFGIVSDSLSGASLSATKVKTDSDGTAYVTVMAPSTPGTFRVKAAVGDDLSAERLVSVSSPGFGSVLVVSSEPSPSGSEFVARAYAGVSCAEALSGQRAATAQAEGTLPLSLTSLPAGPTIAIVLSDGELSGCVVTGALRPDEVSTVSVPLAAQITPPVGTFDAAFVIEQSTEWLSSLWETSSSSILGALGTNKEEEMDELSAALEKTLDADQREEFLAVESSVQSAFEQVLDANGSVSSALTQEMEAALQTPVAGTFQATFGVQNGTTAAFTPHSFQGDSALDSGFSALGPWTLSQPAPDSYLLEGSVQSTPGLWWLRATERTNPDVALRLFDCKMFGEVLTVELYTGCDADCSQTHCEAALESLWSDLTSLELPKATLAFAASGTWTQASGGVVSDLEGSFLASWGEEDQMNTCFSGSVSSP